MPLFAVPSEDEMRFAEEEQIPREQLPEPEETIPKKKRKSASRGEKEAPKAIKTADRAVAKTEKSASEHKKAAEKPFSDRAVAKTEKSASEHKKAAEKPFSDRAVAKTEKSASEHKKAAEKPFSDVESCEPTHDGAKNAPVSEFTFGNGSETENKPFFGGEMKRRIVAVAAAFAVFVAVCAVLIPASDLLAAKTTHGSRIYISEIMTSNTSSYPAPDGEFYDWIELHNPTDVRIDISGFGFGVDSAAAVWTIPDGTILPANGYAVVYCAGKIGNTGADNKVFSTFKLSKKGGETVRLRTSDGTVIDTVETVFLESGQAMYRESEGSEFLVYDAITPLFPNTSDGREAYFASLAVSDDPFVISEIAPKNDVGLTDAFGQTSDWIELRNTSSKAVSLNGYKLSDDVNSPYAWTFPDVTVGAGEYIYVFCTGRDEVADGEIHTGFSLSAKSGAVILSRPDGGTVDRVEYSDVETDESYMRDDNGIFISTQWQTPGFENSVAGYEKYASTLETSDGLVINEIMVGNEKYCAHNGGRYYDWAELYNASDADIDLSEYCISKERSDLGMFALPQRTLRPGEYVLIMFSGDSALSTPTYIHADFKIDNDGETLFLSKNGQIADAVHFSEIRSGYSFGRSSQGNGFFNLGSPTPGSANGTGIRQVSQTPFADTAEGVYDNVEGVTVALSAFGDAKIYYTTDCTVPTYQSAEYVGEPLTFDKTTVLKAVSYEKGKLPSKVVTLSYIVNENHTLPVISLSAEPDDLFDYYTGIYADGPGYTSGFPHKGANFWQDWERDAHVAFFAEGEEGFSLDCGIKMFGNYGRAYDQKPFQLKFRKKYGTSELHYKVFEQYDDISVFESLVLRCGSQDSYRARFRDELFTSLVADSDSTVAVQAYRACVLYLNGEYWGVYYIREKVDENYLSQHTNYAPETFSLLYRNGEVEEGTESGYAALVNFVAYHDMTNEENYRYVCERMDVLNYIDLKIFQAYSGNIDLHNVRYYVSNDPESDGKWRWIFYDQDFAFRDLGSSVARTVEEGYTFISNSLFRNLLKNPEFKDLYLSRTAELFGSALSADTVLARINELYEEALPEMERHCERWSLSFDNWKYEVDTLRRIVSDSGSIEGRSGLSRGGSRIAQVLENLKSTLSLTTAEFDKYFGSLPSSQ